MKAPIPFYKFRLAYAFFSATAALGLLGWVFFGRGGFNLGIDFQPGISMVVAVADSQAEEIRQALSGLPYSYSVQTSGTAGEYFLRAPIPGSKEDLLEDMQNQAIQALTERFGPERVQLLSVDYIGPSLSADLVLQTILLTLVVLALMGLYITLRFRLGYALSAVICLVHDVVFTLAVIGALGVELSTAVVAAILTLIGYSINDTIVVFDRIRENVRLHKDLKLAKIIDLSVTQSLGRTLVTSLTTLLVVTVLVAVTDGDVRSFSFTLLVGIIVGTYSSIGIASPLLPLFKSVRRDVAMEQEPGKA